MDAHEYATGGAAAGVPGIGERRGHGGLAVAICLMLLLATGGLALWAHNGMLARAEAVEGAWAQVESGLQRRADLVPRLVQTVNRYVRHESELLLGVTRQRAALGAAPVGAAQLEALAREDAALQRGVRSLLAVAEGYPELRSADQFLELQAQLEGSENRLHVARMAYNDAVRGYNAALVSLPTSFVARSRGLERRPYFQAAEGARQAAPLGFE